MEAQSKATIGGFLEGLGRKELQAMAKTHGVKANQKSVDIISDLTTYFIENFSKEDEAERKQDAAATVEDSPPAVFAARTGHLAVNIDVDIGQSFPAQSPIAEPSVGADDAADAQMDSVAPELLSPRSLAKRRRTWSRQTVYIHSKDSDGVFLDPAGASVSSAASVMGDYEDAVVSPTATQQTAVPRTAVDEEVKAAEAENVDPSPSRKRKSMSLDTSIVSAFAQLGADDSSASMSDDVDVAVKENAVPASPPTAAAASASKPSLASRTALRYSLATTPRRMSVKLTSLESTAEELEKQFATVSAEVAQGSSRRKSLYRPSFGGAQAAAAAAAVAAEVAAEAAAEDAKASEEANLMSQSFYYPASAEAPVASAPAPVPASAAATASRSADVDYLLTVEGAEEDALGDLGLSDDEGAHLCLFSPLRVVTTRSAISAVKRTPAVGGMGRPRRSMAAPAADAAAAAAAAAAGAATAGDASATQTRFATPRAGDSVMFTSFASLADNGESSVKPATSTEQQAQEGDEKEEAACNDAFRSAARRRRSNVVRKPSLSAILLDGSILGGVAAGGRTPGSKTPVAKAQGGRTPGAKTPGGASFVVYEDVASVSVMTGADAASKLDTSAAVPNFHLDVTAAESEANVSTAQPTLHSPFAGLEEEGEGDDDADAAVPAPAPASSAGPLAEPAACELAAPYAAAQQALGDSFEAAFLLASADAAQDENAAPAPHQYVYVPAPAADVDFAVAGTVVAKPFAVGRKSLAPIRANVARTVVPAGAPSVSKSKVFVPSARPSSAQPPSKSALGAGGFRAPVRQPMPVSRPLGGAVVARPLPARPAPNSAVAANTGIVRKPPGQVQSKAIAKPAPGHATASTCVVSKAPSVTAGAVIVPAKPGMARMSVAGAPVAKPIAMRR